MDRAKIRAAAEQLEYGLGNVVEELDALLVAHLDADVTTLKGAIDYSAEQAATILQLTKPQEA